MNGLGRAGTRAAGPLLLFIMMAWHVAAATAQEPPLESLLRLHHEQRVAHVLGDAELLTRVLADPFVEISGGRIGSVDGDALAERFAAYFRSATFVEWEDVRPPLVEVDAGGGGATVHVGKRVRLIGGEGRVEAVRFAWTERWELRGAGWRMVSLTSTDGPEPGPDPPDGAVREAHRTLGRARAAVGGEAAVARVAMIDTDARCEGPAGSYRMRVASARDGRVLFHQRFGDRPDVVIGMGLGGPWRLPGPEGGAGGAGASRAAEVAPALLAVVRAHEAALLALAPESRWRTPRSAGSGTLDGRSSEVVVLLDALDGSVEVHYDTATGLPLGYVVPDHGGAEGGPGVEVHLDGWRRVGEVLVPHEVRFAAGDGVYACRAGTVSTGWLGAATFEAEGAERGR